MPRLQRARTGAVTPSLRPRRLVIEALETRQLLDAAPWQNPDQPLDVDRDGFTVALDALIIINRINSGVDAKLPDVPVGEIPNNFYDVDGDGFATATDVLQIVNRLNGNYSAPLLAAGLANDTGFNADAITTDTTIAGQLTDPLGMVQFTAAINGGAAKSIRNLLQPNGVFTLTNASLAQLLDENLADGAYLLELHAINELGFSATKLVSWTLDREIAQPGTPDLTAASDTGTSATDNITKIAAPDIVVPAEPGSIVTLYINGTPTLQTMATTVASFTLPTMADGVYEVTARAVDGAGNVSTLSAPLDLTIRGVAPVIKMLTVPYQDDVTPMIKAVVTSTPKIEDGTPIYLDIDRNGDGDYDDPDELGTAQATIYNGGASVQVTQALAAANVDPYLINVRLRVVDVAGHDVSVEESQLVETIASNALADYVNKDDGMFNIGTLVELPRQAGYRAYVVQMTSQQWRTEVDVDKPIWKHWVTIVVPTGLNPANHTALLNITGGNNDNGQPTSVDSNLVLIAQATRSIVINLPQVPSEPLVFTADESPGRKRTEDQIIAYSYDEFLKNPSDTEWPVLIAMVKSAVKAMDTVQTLVAEDRFPTLPDGYSVDDFVITGGSKRGWTTWLVPAVDDRVRGIMPTVFDALNLDEQMQHHYGAYGFFSQAIVDYEEEQVFERILTQVGSELGRIVDPYHYMAAGVGHYEIPKYAIVSAGDEFFVSDSSQYYFDDLPGTQNYLRYVPNAGHGLNQDAVLGGLVWYNALINNIALPRFNWKIQDDGRIVVDAIDQPTTVTLWRATNPLARDYRYQYTGIGWTSETLTSEGDGVYSANVPIPTSGATAFFIELTYPSGLIQPFKFTTGISVQTNLPLYDWAFDKDIPTAPIVTPEESIAAAAAPVELPSVAWAATVATDNALISQFATNATPLAASIITPVRSIRAEDAARALALGAITSSTAETSADDGNAFASDLVDSALDDDALDFSAEFAELLQVLDHDA